jgi:type IV pilus assembly protein PilB
MLDQQAAEAIFQRAEDQRTSFIAELTGSGALSAYELAHKVSEAFSTPLIDLDAAAPQKLPKDLLDAKVCAELGVLVLSKRGNRLMVATADPSDQTAAERIKFASGLQVDWVIAEYDKLSRWVDMLAKSTAEVLDFMVGDDVLLDEFAADGLSDGPTSNSEVDDAPVVKFLQKCWWTPLACGPLTCTLNLLSTNTACGFALTANCAKWPTHLWPLKTSWPRASRSFPSWTFPKNAFPKTAA